MRSPWVMFGITAESPSGHLGELPVDPDDDSLRMRDRSCRFRRYFPGGVGVPGDLVDVVGDGPDKALQGGKLYELVAPLGRAFAVLIERGFDQKPRDRDAVLFRQGEKLGFFFRTDLVQTSPRSNVN
jgi:hypothetical protein